MDPLDREILVLRHYEQMTNGDAAAALDLEKSAASKRYTRALAAAQGDPGRFARRRARGLTMSEPTVDRDPFEVVAESFLARFRAGQRPSIEDLAARHPELADQIRELLPALVMVEQDLTIDRRPGSNGSQPPPAPPPGKERRLGDYRILREIGRGGMGVVYEAEQVSLGRQVALKVLPGQVAGDRLALERFRREAKSAARLHHTNIVPVFEVGRDGEVAYYAMQFIEGQGLDKVIDELARLRDPGRKPGVAEGPGPTVDRRGRPRAGSPRSAGSRSRS